MHGEEFFMDAFWLLSTERAVGMEIGEIPWSKMIEYGLHAGLDRDMLDLFVIAIRQMDERYLAWHKDEAEKARQSTTTPKK